MKISSSRRLAATFALSLCVSFTFAGAFVRADSPIISPISSTRSGASFRVTATTYKSWSAFRLNNGKSEAIVVPEIGRVMSYGLVGGENWIYNAVSVAKTAGIWKNWGGDKTWAGPQLYWTLAGGGRWPQDSAWDGTPQSAQILPDGHLRMESQVSDLLGARVVRDFSFDENGEFVIVQTVEKSKGEPIVLSIWNVTQIVPPDAVFLPIDAQSPYKNNFYQFWNTSPLSTVKSVTPTLLQAKYSAETTYKIASSSTNTAMAAVKNGFAFIERADAGRTTRRAREYPDGAEGNGFPLEMYNNSDAKARYIEMELLSPLRVARLGDSLSQTVRWSLKPLKAKSVDSPALHAEIEAILQPKS